MAFNEWGSDGVFKQRTGIVDSNGDELFTNSNNGYVTSKPLPTTSKSEKNLVTVDDTATGTEILAANSNRLSAFIQNQGIEPILISLGENTSITNYSIVLSAGSGIRVGDGGSYVFDRWQGSIRGLTEQNSTVVSIFEEVVD